MKTRMTTRILIMGIIILQVVIFIYGGWGCSDTEEKTPDNAGESVYTLPKDALGTFTGEESGYSLDVGRKRVFVPASKWQLRLKNASIQLKQSGEAATFQYEGQFLVEMEDDTALTIIARLSEVRTQSLYTPRLRFNKIKNVWLLENGNNDEEVILTRR